MGLELSPFHPSRPQRNPQGKDLGIGPDNFVVGSIGRLTGIKDHRTLLRGLALAKKAVSRPLTLVVVGQGELEGEIRAEAAALGLDVRFMGWQPGTADLLPGFDLVALTSLNEGLPLVLIEALAAGRPVVSTPVGGVPSLLNMGEGPSLGNFSMAERGLLFPVGDPERAGQSGSVDGGSSRSGRRNWVWPGRNMFWPATARRVLSRAHAELYRELFQERHG